MEESKELQRNLKNRHIQMIALGGAIGTGLFYGSASTIQLVGPGVTVAYAIGGLFIFLVMRALGEMSVHTPVSGAFSTYAYSWFPGMSMWGSALITFMLMTFINMNSVKFFGEMEFWGAIIKVTAIIAMIIFGLSIVLFGVGNGGEPIGFSNLYREGGFFPFGIKGLLLSLIMVAFSFGVVELVGITAGEAENPTKNIPQAINHLIFYVGSMFVLVTLFPS